MKDFLKFQKWIRKKHSGYVRFTQLEKCLSSSRTNVGNGFGEQSDQPSDDNLHSTKEERKKRQNKSSKCRYEVVIFMENSSDTTQSIEVPISSSLTQWSSEKKRKFCNFFNRRKTPFAPFWIENIGMIFGDAQCDGLCCFQWCQSDAANKMRRTKNKKWATTVKYGDDINSHHETADLRRKIKTTETYTRPMFPRLSSV